jgi:hypothetical protein
MANWQKFETEVSFEVTLTLTHVSDRGALKIESAEGAGEVDGGTVTIKRNPRGQIYFLLTHPEEDGKAAAKAEMKEIDAKPRKSAADKKRYLELAALLIK